MRLVKKAIGDTNRLEIKRRENGKFVFRQLFVNEKDKWEITQQAEFDYYNRADSAFNRELCYMELKTLRPFKNVYSRVAW